MTIHSCEYLWLDGYEEDACIRSKREIVVAEEIPTIDNLPYWSYFWSPSKPTKFNCSDCILKPVEVWKDPNRVNGYFVMCEVLNHDGAPHDCNNRAAYRRNQDNCLGIEQKFFFTKNGLPLRSSEENNPLGAQLQEESGEGKLTSTHCVEEHLNQCLSCGLNITGFSDEQLTGQWKYYLESKDSRCPFDDYWLSRFLLMGLAEKYNLHVKFLPKSIKTDAVHQPY